MSNVLDDDRQGQIRALGRLGWTLSRIEQATGVRRETISGYLKAAGIPVRPRGRPGEEPYLFAGSHQAAARAARLYNVTRTRAQYGVPPLEYLTDVLRKLADGWCVNRLEELLPHRWRDEHGEAIAR